MWHALFVMQVQTVSGKKHGVSPDFTLAHMTQLIMPQHANSLGITFGGQVCHVLLLFWASCMNVMLFYSTVLFWACIHAGVVLPAG